MLVIIFFKNKGIIHRHHPSKIFRKVRSQIDPCRNGQPKSRKYIPTDFFSEHFIFINSNFNGFTMPTLTLEKTFSALNTIKNYLHNTIGEKN